MKRLLVLACFAALAAHADEGMWTFDNFPSAKVGKRHGFAPDAKWLEEARLSSVRLAGGCSGSFVSADGLVMTNHHCAHSCIQQLSTKEKDFVKEGFYAPQLGNEVKCPEIELNQLLSITEVTKELADATEGLSGPAFNEKQRAAMSAIEKECAAGDDFIRCDVVTLYHGGRYDLYKYKRYQDVRLVFAPEFAIAFFGGDPDNFNFPRYDLDVSFLRAYENDRPVRAEHYFKWSPSGAREGELTFVSGHPGSTHRDLTLAQLLFERDVAIPETTLYYAELRGYLAEMVRRGPEEHRLFEDVLLPVENNLKRYRGFREALVDPRLMEAKAAAEKSLRAKVKAIPALQKEVGGAWEKIAKATDRWKQIRTRYLYLEGIFNRQPRGFGFSDSYTFRRARMLVRAADELQKPNGERLREFTEGALPQLKQKLFSTAPVYDELEVEGLRYSVTRLREALGADDPLVKKVLGKKSPEEMAKEIVAGTTLKDPAARRKLFEGGKASVDASTDPAIALARLVDADARAVRKIFEEEVEAVEKREQGLIAKARFRVEGTSNYPDATFTLRLSYGAVKGYEENGRHVAPITALGGAFDRATGRDPFKLPDSWLRAGENKQINLGTTFDFCSTNDTIGGNSGSPVFDKDRQIVGLVFDGNIQSLGGDYGYDESVNRTVAVSSTALMEALEHIYGAKRVVGELKGSGSASGGP